jgi:hypothetical protein
MTRSFAVFVLAHMFLNISVLQNGICEEKLRPRYEYGLSLLGGGGHEDDPDIRYYAA